MSTTTTTDLAAHVIATLQAHEAEQRRAGIRHLSLFGSVARGDAGASSDVDLAAELDPDAHIGLFGLGALERRLAELAPSRLTPKLCGKHSAAPSGAATLLGCPPAAHGPRYDRHGAMPGLATHHRCQRSSPPAIVGSSATIANRPEQAGHRRESSVPPLRGGTLPLRAMASRLRHCGNGRSATTWRTRTGEV